MKKTVLIGVSGGIAAFKTLELVRNLAANNLDVRVIMTKSASSMVAPSEFEKACGNPVYQELFSGGFNYKTILENRKVDHIELANTASLLVIVPATANVIAKMAAGIADDYLTTTALAATCPILIAPSMNVYMWKNPLMQKNLKTLHETGVHFIGPDSGMLACGYTGTGRLADITAIEKEILRFVNTTDDLRGKKIIITAGGTTEPIDDIRVITNKSSGKMGIAIAEECFLRGARVLLLRSHTSVEPRYGMEEKTFDTADSLQQLLKAHVPDFDICIHVAAVSDFQVKHKTKGKISSANPLPLELEPRSKILDSIKSYNPDIFLVAFKAEWGVTDEKLIDLATSRLSGARADLIVANDVGRPGQGFQTDDNEVIVIDSKGQSTHIAKASKPVVARGITDIVVSKNT